MLKVADAYTEQECEPLLLETLPSDLEVFESGALSARWTRKFGLGSLGLRSMYFLYWQARKIIEQQSIDLLFFSTTVFPAIAVGRILHKQFGIPFVVDMQDPWRNDYYLSAPKENRQSKFWFDYRLQAYLEAWTMPYCSGLIAVSSAYIEELNERYPQLQGRPSATIPFSFLPRDVEIAKRLPPFKFEPGTINVAYVGRGGGDLRPALNIIFQGLKLLLDEDPDLATKLKFHFLGTSYAPKGQGRKTIQPVAEDCGVADLVVEQTDRMSYFEVLTVLAAADILLIPGSEDARYTASKLYPYLQADKPLLAVVHEASGMVQALSSVGLNSLTFSVSEPNPGIASEFAVRLRRSLNNPLELSHYDREAFKAFESEAMTKRMCSLFNEVASGP